MNGYLISEGAFEIVQSSDIGTFLDITNQKVFHDVLEDTTFHFVYLE